MASHDSDNDELGSCTTPPRKKARVWYRQPFNDEWLQIEEFKHWLKPDPSNKYAARCTVCSTSLINVNRSALTKHAESVKHVKNNDIKRSTFTINHFLQKPTTPSIDCKVAQAEIVLTAFVAEHNVPFSHMDHLVECMKTAFPDSQIAQKLTLKSTKLSYVLQDGLAYSQRRNVVDRCKSQKFSVLLDESTDISVSQVLAVVVRFFDESRCTVVDALFDLIEVDNGTAAGLYSSFKELMISNQIPLENIIGFASDNCATMMGQNNGFQVLLKADVPQVVVVGCICHSIALCANHASQSLPSWLESFVKDVSFYFSRSSKRCQAFDLIQDVVAVKKHRVLKLCQTRWLSRGQVVERIIEQWEALELFFQSESQTDKVDCAGSIYKTMRTAGTKHVLLFLGYVLKKVNVMNLEFQSQHFRLHKVFGTICDEYRCLLGMFVRGDVITSRALSAIDPRDTSVHKAIAEIELGGRCESMLVKQPLGDKEIMFRKDALSFLVELCTEIRKRFPLSSGSLFALLKLLDPVEAVGTQLATDPSYVRPSIIPLAAHFPNLVPECELDTIQEQWRTLHYATDSLCHLTDRDPPHFWKELGCIKDGNDGRRFGILSDFMCTLLALPHSTACVERIFSHVNLIKNKQSNTMKSRTVADRILAKQSIAQQSAECHSWTPPTTLVEDVREGRCHARYVARHRQQQQSNTINIVTELSDSDSHSD